MNIFIGKKEERDYDTVIKITESAFKTMPFSNEKESILSIIPNLVLNLQATDILPLPLMYLTIHS